MLYKSTRGGETVNSAQAIAKGLALDSGLFVPEKFPSVSMDDLQFLMDKDYLQQAVFVLNKYLVGYSSGEIKECVEKTYDKDSFGEQPVVLKKVSDDVFVLELWHGPTFAFKDMALQLLPHLLTKAIEKTGEQKEVVVLVATSGDTGKAALEGFANVAGTRIIVFYPEQGVSQIQKLQMITQQGDNVDVVAIEGNFDDAQTGVKNLFSDKVLAEQLEKSGYVFSSANSINWGRLVPQIVYYFNAYLTAVKNKDIKLGDKINFCVPTGNFGNILAGFYAKCMGLPIHKFICASNANDVLTDFINTGCYNRKRPFHKTNSPSMDILVSSNLERLLYNLTDGDSAQINEWMKQLNDEGCYDIGKEYTQKLQELFWGYHIDDDLTKETIKEVFTKYNYLLDTHTAVAWQACQQYKQQHADDSYTIVLSTASPFKFADSVLQAITGGEMASDNPFENLLKLSDVSGVKAPVTMEMLAQQPILHSEKIESTQMKQFVAEKLHLK